MNHRNVKQSISGIILSGGKSSRMGQDKGLMKINGQALIQYTLQQVEPQVTEIFINTNQNQEQYQKLLIPLIADIDSSRLGPLSGIYSSLKKITSNWAFFCACDTPCIPSNIVNRLFLIAERQQKSIAVVASKNKLQPLVILLQSNLSDSLNNFLVNGGRKTQQWILQQDPAILDCSNEHHKFININTAEQIIEFQKALQLKKNHE